MDNYTHDGTAKTPSINFDLKNGSLQIKGWSVPENAIEFYVPLLEALDKYTSAVKPATNVDISLEYFNTSSSKSILGVFKKLERIQQSGSEVTINWHYEKDDEDMLQALEDYKAVVKLPINAVIISN